MRRTLVGITLLLAAGLAVGSPAGAATFTDFVEEGRLVSVSEPEQTWQSDGILHVRGQLFTAKVKGDLGKGIFLVVENYEVDLTTGFGLDNHGTWVLETEAGTWSGTYAIAGGEFPFFIPLVGHGEDGSLLKAEFVPTGPTTAELRGTILSP